MPTYTHDDIEALVTKMAEERGTLIAAAERLTDDEANAVPTDAVGEEQWTGKEQLSHLWEMEKSYIAWCRAAIEQDGADVAGVRGDPVGIPIEDAPAHSVRELLDELIAERAATNEFIRSLSLDQFHRTARTDAFGELTVMQWLRSFYRHDRQHGAQIQGRQSDYQPNFQSGLEPNQRTARIQHRPTPRRLRHRPTPRRLRHRRPH